MSNDYKTQFNRYERLIGKSVRDQISCIYAEFEDDPEKIIASILWYKNISNSFNNLGVRQPPTISPDQVEKKNIKKNNPKIYWILGHFYTRYPGKALIHNVFKYFKNLSVSGKAIFTITIPNFYEEVIKQWEKWLDQSRKIFDLDFEYYAIKAKNINIGEQVYQLSNLLQVLLPIKIASTSESVWKTIYTEIITHDSNTTLLNSGDLNKGYRFSTTNTDYLNNCIDFPLLGNLLTVCMILPLPVNKIELFLMEQKNKNYAELNEELLKFETYKFSTLVKPLLWRRQLQGIVYLLKRTENDAVGHIKENKKFTLKDQSLFSDIVDEYDIVTTIKEANRKIFLFSINDEINKKQTLHPFIQILDYLPLSSTVKAHIASLNIEDKYITFFKIEKIETQTQIEDNSRALHAIIETMFPKNIYYSVSQQLINPEEIELFFTKIQGLFPEKYLYFFKKYDLIILLRISTLKNKKDSFICLFFNESPQKIKSSIIDNKVLYDRNAREIYGDIEQGIKLIADNNQNIKVQKAIQILDALEEKCIVLSVEGKEINPTELAAIYISPLRKKNKKVSRMAIRNYFTRDYSEEIKILSKKYPNRWPNVRKLEIWPK